MFLVLHHRNMMPSWRRAVPPRRAALIASTWLATASELYHKSACRFPQRGRVNKSQQLFGALSEPQRTCSEQLVVPYRVPGVDSRLQCSSPLLVYKSLSGHVSCQSLWEHDSGFTVCFPSPGHEISLNRSYSRICIDQTPAALTFIDLP